MVARGLKSTLRKRGLVDVAFWQHRGNFRTPRGDSYSAIDSVENQFARLPAAGILWKDVPAFSGIEVRFGDLIHAA